MAYLKSVGHEVPGVVDVLCECMGGYRDGDIPLSVPFVYHLALLHLHLHRLALGKVPF